MKFRDPKTGEVFEDIGAAYSTFCEDRICDGSCPLDAASKRESCYTWMCNHPVDAAHLMGYEVVEDDITLINRISKMPLTESEVYTFPVHLCDNEVDRGFERFDEAALSALGDLFLGKSGIFDHQWSARGQTARIYRTEVQRQPGRITAAGDGYCCLKAWAYLPRTEKSAELIAEIENDIKGEISVGCSIGSRVCSICGSEAGTCGHALGRTYGGALCYAELREPVDAYEWSFVAAPVKKKEEPMERTDKPRICEVLGVEQAMKIITAALQEDKSPGSWYYSWQSNLACTIMDNADIDHDTANKIAVRFLDRLCESKPRFTQEEVVMAKMLAGIGYVALARDADDELNAFKRDPAWEGSEWMSTAPAEYVDWDKVPSGLFPSLRPGQAVSLEEVVGDRK